MAFCSVCGSQLPDAARFCPSCGATAQGGSAPDAPTATGPSSHPTRGPAAGSPPVGHRSPNAGCGKTAAIGCGAIIAVVLLFAIIGAIISGFNQSASTGSKHVGSRAPGRTGHHKPAAAPTPQVLLDVEGSGIKTTQRFQVPDEWAIGWSYDCSNFGGSGNFIVSVDGDVSDTAANQLGASGHDVSYEHSGGNVYLQINSECDWHVRAVSQ
jgi:hypothetical protein